MRTTWCKDDDSGGVNKDDNDSYDDDENHDGDIYDTIVDGDDYDDNETIHNMNFIVEVV